MIFQRKYGVDTTTAAAHIYIPIIKRGSVDFALTGDWTPAAGDVIVLKDGASPGNIATLPNAVAVGSGYCWRFVFSSGELTCKQTFVSIVDQGTKTIEDQSFIIETYGNPSAMWPADASADTTDSDQRFTRAVKGNVLGTVGSGSTTTSIVTSSLSPAAVATDQFKGRVLTFTNDTSTQALRGQGTDITASSSGGVLTVSALSTPPQNTDLFTIT